MIDRDGVCAWCCCLLVLFACADDAGYVVCSLFVFVGGVDCGCECVCGCVYVVVVCFCWLYLLMLMFMCKRR